MCQFKNNLFIRSMCQMKLLLWWSFMHGYVAPSWSCIAWSCSSPTQTRLVLVPILFLCRLPPLLFFWSTWTKTTYYYYHLMENCTLLIWLLPYGCQIWRRMPFFISTSWCCSLVLESKIYVQPFASLAISPLNVTRLWYHLLDWVPLW